MACLLLSVADGGEFGDGNSARLGAGPVFAAPVPSALRGALAEHASQLASAYGEGHVRTPCAHLVCASEDESLACASALFNLAPVEAAGEEASIADAVEALLRPVEASNRAAAENASVSQKHQQTMKSRTKHTLRLLERVRSSSLAKLH